MNLVQAQADDPRMQQAVGELRDAIRERYPSASFEAVQGEEGLPLRVIPVRTPERVLASMQEQLSSRARRSDQPLSSIVRALRKEQMSTEEAAR